MIFGTVAISDIMRVTLIYAGLTNFELVDVGTLLRTYYCRVKLLMASLRYIAIHNRVKICMYTIDASKAQFCSTYI